MRVPRVHPAAAPRRRPLDIADDGVAAGGVEEGGEHERRVQRRAVVDVPPRLRARTERHPFRHLHRPELLLRRQRLRLRLVGRRRRRSPAYLGGEAEVAAPHREHGGRRALPVLGAGVGAAVEQPRRDILAAGGGGKVQRRAPSGLAHADAEDVSRRRGVRRTAREQRRRQPHQPEVGSEMERGEAIHIVGGEAAAQPRLERE